MVWSRANLVAPVGPPPRCHNRRSAGCTPVAFPVGCCLGRRGGETLHCCRLPRHRLTSGAATQLHYCADLLCCACRCRYCLLSHCSSAPLSYGSATAAHCRAASYIAATPRRAAPAAAPRRSAAAASLSCCPTPPPTALLLPRRSSTLPRCSAPRRSASLCYMLPALHRAASLLPRCFAAAAPLRYCHSTARPPLLNQSLLGLEHSKTCLQTGLRKATQACFPSGNRCRPCGFHRDLRGRTVFRCLHFLSCSPFFLCSLSSPLLSRPLLSSPILSSPVFSSPLPSPVSRAKRRCASLVLDDYWFDVLAGSRWTWLDLFKSLRSKIVFVLLSVRRVGASYVSMCKPESLHNHMLHHSL